MNRRRVVVTGCGVVSPLDIGIGNHRQALFSNCTAIRKSARLSSMEYPLCSAGEIPEEALQFYIRSIPPRQRKLMNRAGLLAAIACSLALDEAGLEKGRFDPVRFGVFLGTWFTAYDLPSFVRYLAESESELSPGRMDAQKANQKWLEKMNPVDYSLKVLPNLSVGHLAILHRAQGRSQMIADGWRGGLLAVAQAAGAIGQGELDLALAGGSESPLEEGVFSDLCLLEVMAGADNGSDGLCRPFDARRRGMVLGEGAGTLLLEEREHALRRGAKIFGEILGSASAISARSLKEALEQAMKTALIESRLDPDGIDLIHANGDSTREHDRAEWQAIESLFSAAGGSAPVTASKSLHGHLLSASGAVELVSSLLMLEAEQIPPIVNCDLPDPGCRLDLVRDSARRRPGMKNVLLNAMGLFGEATTLVAAR